ncbi:MAG: protein jag, partial [Chloroflexi bacterium]|nr:protein jag [Chloroflexota bacterium]
LIIDVEGYRTRREQQIRQLTRRIADQVIQTNRRQSLEPMPANERRLAHLELQDDPLVYTESTGFGRQRKVIIYPKD